MYTIDYFIISQWEIPLWLVQSYVRNGKFLIDDIHIWSLEEVSLLLAYTYLKPLYG